MKSTAIVILALVLVVVGLFGLAATVLLTQGPGSSLACPGGDCPGNGRIGSGEIEGVPPVGVSGVDAMFITGMIPHHDDAIAMAELALTQAEHPEIKQLAENIIRTQSAENAQMREWYLEWYGEEVPESGDGFGMMGGRGMMGGGFDAADLEGADPFDKAFIEQMIPHHQMGIMMARMAGSRTQSPEISGLTDDIIVGQSAEIEQMQGWYEEWYGN